MSAVHPIVRVKPSKPCTDFPPASRPIASEVKDLVILEERLDFRLELVHGDKFVEWLGIPTAAVGVHDLHPRAIRFAIAGHAFKNAVVK
jgi:hypothetical protein